MPRFFVNSLEDTIYMTGEDACHVSRSLRMKRGDNLTLCDGEGNDAHAVIQSIDGGSVVLSVLSRERSASEPRLQVTVFQALPKADKLEHILQKVTELGAVAVQPFLSRYCVSRPKDFGKKIARLERIALEAAKQSGRGRIPKVLPLLELDDICRRIAEFDRVILCYEGAERPLRDVLAEAAQWRHAAVVVGSEGGFSPDEVAMLENAGAVACLMGARILRCETAPVAALAALMLSAGEM